MDAGAVGTEGAEGGEDTRGATGCPKTVLVGVAIVLLAMAGVEVVAAVATVLITGVTPMELLSVVTGAGCVKIEPGFSEMGT